MLYLKPTGISTFILKVRTFCGPSLVYFINEQGGSNGSQLPNSKDVSIDSNAPQILSNTIANEIPVISDNTSEGSNQGRNALGIVLSL